MAFVAGRDRLASTRAMSIAASHGERALSGVDLANPIRIRQSDCGGVCGRNDDAGSSGS